MKIKSKSIKLIVSVILILSVLANPIIMAVKDDTAKAYYQEELSQEEYQAISDDDAILITEAGGPYQTVPGGLITFNGYFQLLELLSINITGYTWDFGDGETFNQEYNPVINFTSFVANSVHGRILCSATHLYPNYGHYTATLTIHLEDISIYRSHVTKPIEYKHYYIMSFDTATVDVEYDPWDEQNNPNNYFKKQVWDEQDGWSETTNCSIGDPIQFKISYTATGRTDDVEVKDYLPPTVRFVSAVPSPNSEGSQVYFDQTNEYYIPTKILTWNVGYMYAGELVEIIVNGVVEQLPKSYFGIPNDGFPIHYKTENKATLKGTKYSPGCGNPYTFRYTATADFTIIQEHPNLKIEKFVKKNCCGEYDPDMITVNKGEWVTFWIKVTNTGDFVFEDTNVTDTLPAGLTYLNNARVNGVAQEPIFIDDHNFYWNIGTLEINQTVNITFQANADECGFFRNFAFVKGYYSCEEFTDEDDVAVNVNCTPDVFIEKTVRETQCDPWVEHVDLELYDEIYFKIGVTNTGETVLNLVVSDVLPDNLRYINDSANYTPSIDEQWNVNKQRLTWLFMDVNPDEHIEIVFKAEVVGCGFGVNWAYVFDREQNVFDEDNATVNIDCNPAVSVEKYVKWDCTLPFEKELYITPQQLEIARWVTFKIYVNNTGNTPLNITVRDELPSGLTYANDASPKEYDYNDGNNYYWNFTDVQPGVSIVVTFRANIDDCGEFVNVANVTGRYECQIVYDQSSALVDVPCEPSIFIDKQVKWNCCGEYGDYIYAHNGDWVTFKIEVTNSGDVPLDINVSDSLPIGFTYDNHATPHEPDDIVTPLNGHIIYVWNVGIVEPDQTVVITFRATVDECGSLINDASATAFYNDQELFDSDAAVVFVLCPAINISKEADQDIIHLGDTVIYTYNVTSTGNCPLRNVVVTDDKIPLVDYVSGDTNTDGWLNLSETWIYQASAELYVDTTNTGTVTAEDELGKQVSDEDDAFVDVINPDIKVVKTVQPCCVLPGESATWNITVENTGDVTLTGVCVVDDEYGVLDSMITLAPGEKIYYEYVTNPCVETTNVVDVNGTDPLGLEVTNNSSATVLICDQPNIDFDVEKIVKWNCLGITYGDYIYAHVGDWVTFNITIENTGDEPLDLTVCDILPENLTMFGQPRVNGDPVDPVDMCWTIGNLLSGDEVTILFTSTVDECGEHVNKVVVTGYHEGYEPIIKQDTATVFALCPGIHIEKTADPTNIHPGEEVTYTYEVNNTGNCPLRNVVVTDDKIPLVDYVSGDTNTDGWLNLSETWIYQASAELYVDTTNTGTVTAEDELGKQVSDEDDAFVDVEECGCVTGVSIDKKVFYDGEWSDNLDVQTDEDHINVTFKITVENTGTCDLENISIIDTYECGIENPRDFTGDFTEYEIISDQIFFSVDEPFTSEADSIVIMFNATIYISTLNHVEVLADSTYDETHVCKHDSVTIELNDETPVNHEPYKPVDPSPENLEENISINQLLSVYVEDPDGGTLSVSFYNETDVLLGTTVDDVASGTRAELSLSDLEYETWYSWYAVVSDGEYINTSDVFSFKTKKDTGLDPTVKITTPEPDSIYFRGFHITASFLDNALVIGGINITVDADDADGEITNIDFIIDGEIKNSTTNTYYYWNEICFGWYTILVRVTDDMGNTAEDEVDVFMISRGL